MAIPDAPTGLTITDSRDNEVDITWMNNHTSGSARVDYREVGNSSWITEDSGLALSTESLTVGGLKNGEYYEIRVVAVNQDGEQSDHVIISGTLTVETTERTLTTTKIQI